MTNLEQLEEEREKKIIQVLELKTKVQELVDLWMSITEEIKTIELKIIEEIHNGSNKNN